MQKVIDAIMGALETIVDLVMSLIGLIIKPMFADTAVTFRELGDEVFTGFMTRAIEVLQMTPEEWNAEGWGYIINTAYGVFVAFGSQLVLVFFLISFFNESIEPQKEMRLETIIKALIKILFAQFLVVYSLEIITTLFDIIGTFMNYILRGTSILTNTGVYNMAEWEADYHNVVGATDMSSYLQSVSTGYFILSILGALIYLIVMAGAGGVIAYTAYMRFFKIMLIVPYGAIVSATAAGGHSLNHHTMQYYKYIISVLFEAVTIIVAISLFTYMMRGNDFQVINLKSPHANVLETFINRALAALLLVGAVKGAGAITQKGLGS